MKMKLLLAALLALAASSAQASLLEGKTINYQYYYPTITSAYPNASNGDHVVGSGVEVPNISENVGALDISDTNLYVDYALSGSWNGASFNGFEISDVLGQIDSFAAVTINAATNLAGFDASRISFDADHIWVNWQGLTFTSDTVVSLDIKGGDKIPEPGSLALVALGLAGASGLLRRRAG